MQEEKGKRGKGMALGRFEDDWIERVDPDEERCAVCLCNHTEIKRNLKSWQAFRVANAVNYTKPNSQCPHSCLSCPALLLSAQLFVSSTAALPLFQPLTQFSVLLPSFKLQVSGASLPHSICLICSRLNFLSPPSALVVVGDIVNALATRLYKYELFDNCTFFEGPLYLHRSQSHPPFFCIVLAFIS